MKTNYTNTQLQAAIDRACLETHREHRGKVGSNLVIDTDDMPSVYAAEASARLQLIKSALAALPEPEPLTVDWKAKAERMEHERNGWSQMHGDMKVRAEKAEVELAAAKESIESQTRVYRKDTEFLEKKLHEAIIKPSLSQLRPLAEAGPVPEGCVRHYTYKQDGEWTTATKHRAMQDTHYIDTRLPEPAENATPETFEAHGKTWTKHKPGDAMPCDGSSAVMALLGDGTFCTQQAKDWNWNNHDSTFDIIGWRYADEQPAPETQGPSIEVSNPVQDMALGGQMYWRDLALQLAEVWWKCHSIGASLQHGDIDNDVSFTVCCELHGGRCFHADTPSNAWRKAEKWLMSPDRENFPALDAVKEVKP